MVQAAVQVVQVMQMVVQVVQMVVQVVLAVQVAQVVVQALQVVQMVVQMVAQVVQMVVQVEAPTSLLSCRLLLSTRRSGQASPFVLCRGSQGPWLGGSGGGVKEG